MKGSGRRVFLGVMFWALVLGGGPAADAGDAVVRASAIAGFWYPADSARLQQLVDGLLERAHPAGIEPAEPLRALISPHAGYKYSGATAAQGYKLLEGRSFRRVIVLGPAHRGGFRGLAVPSADMYSTPLGEIPLDGEAMIRLRAAHPLVSPDAEEGEHSVEIQLPLLQRALPGRWKLLPVLVGRLEPGDYAAAAALLRPLLGPDTLLVVSSDFSHYGPRYGYMPFPPGGSLPERLRRLDMGAFQTIVERDPTAFHRYREETGISVCGYGPIGILLHLLPASAQVRLVDYATSGAATGDYRNSVSYLSVAVYSPDPLGGPGESDPAASGPGSREGTLRLTHELARLAVAAAVEPGNGAAERLGALLADLPPDLQRPAGAFVTLRKHGDLRGCIGWFLPEEPLYRAVIANGMNAALHDRRFQPVRPDELPQLDVEVSVLTPPEPIASPEAFEVGRHGIVIHKDGRTGVYLPEVATRAGWNREQTLTRLAVKAGLPPDAWKTGADLAVFTTTTYRGPLDLPSLSLAGN